MSDTSSTPPRPRRWLRWLKRLGWCALWLVTLATLFTQVENWRGRRAWRTAKAELQAQGWEFDYARFLPARVPDASNFARATVLIAIGTKRKTDTNNPSNIRLQAFGATGLATALRSHPHSGVNFVKGVELLQKAGRLAPNASGESPAQIVRDWIEANHGTDLSELRSAASRPHAVFLAAGTQPFFHDIPNLLTTRQLAQLLALTAHAEFALNRIDAGYSNLLALDRLAEICVSSPTMVTVMIGTAIRNIEVGVIEAALQSGPHSDTELERLRNLLSRAEPLREFDFGMRGERAAMTTLLEQDPKAASVHFLDVDVSYGSRLKLLLWKWLAPSGWIYQNLATYNRWMQESVFASHDVRNGTVDARAVEHRTMDVETKMSLSNPYTFIAARGFPNSVMALRTIAHMQTRLQLAAVAISLERHRLKHSAYPEALEGIDPALKPAGGLPHDVISGGPLRYTRTADGRYHLYAVGWNGTDEGGSIAWKNSEKTQIDFTQGDWVWPQPAAP